MTKERVNKECESIFFSTKFEINPALYIYINLSVSYKFKLYLVKLVFNQILKSD